VHCVRACCLSTPPSVWVRSSFPLFSSACCVSVEPVGHWLVLVYAFIVWMLCFNAASRHYSSSCSNRILLSLRFKPLYLMTMHCQSTYATRSLARVRVKRVDCLCISHWNLDCSKVNLLSRDDCLVRNCDASGHGAPTTRRTHDDEQVALIYA